MTIEEKAKAYDEAFKKVAKDGRHLYKSAHPYTKPCDKFELKSE